MREEPEEFSASSKQDIPLTVNEAESQRPVATEKLPANESRFFVDKENVITRRADYAVTILCLEASEDLEDFHFLSNRQGLIIL